MRKFINLYVSVWVLRIMGFRYLVKEGEWITLLLGCLTGLLCLIPEIIICIIAAFTEKLYTKLYEHNINEIENFED